MTDVTVYTKAELKDLITSLCYKLKTDDMSADEFIELTDELIDYTEALLVLIVEG